METAAGPVAMDTAAPPGGRRHALLAVIGEIGTEPERGALRGALERGIRSWNINTLYCDLNHQLRLFVTRHLAQFSSEVKGSYKEDGVFTFTRAMSASCIGRVFKSDATMILWTFDAISSP